MAGQAWPGEGGLVCLGVSGQGRLVQVWEVWRIAVRRGRLGQTKHGSARCGEIGETWLGQAG
jgi:hypothetical protein